MSLEVICKTEINDRTALVEVLEDLVGKGKVVVVEEGVDVGGYYSNRRPEVLVKVDGLIGTAGYHKNADGNYELVYDSMDGKRLSKITPKKKGTQTIDPVGQAYSKVKTMKLTKKLKGRVTKNEVTQNGLIKIKIKVGY